MQGLSNPAELAHKPHLPQGRDRRLIGDEKARLLVAAEAYGGEIAAMRWEHVDRKARVLLIPGTKNGTPRRVPLSKVAQAVLDRLPRRPDGRVWGMRPDSMPQAFERVCKTAGVENMTFHDLRHEAISRLFEKGLNAIQAAAITGHKTQQMLKRYTHLRAEDLAPLLD